MLTEANRHITARGVGQELSVSKLTIHGHLQTLGFVKRLDVWISRERSERNAMDRASMRDSLLERNKNEPFLKRMSTRDENRTVYSNEERKR